MGTESATTTSTQEYTDAQPAAAEAEVETQGEPESEFPVSLDNIFEILKNQRRRQVLWYLLQRGEQVSLRDLSEYVAAEENGKPIEQLSSQERKRVYVGLYQCHLPKMDDMQFIEFNKDRGVIELGPAAEHAEKYLRTDEPSTHQWPVYYLGLVGIGWLLLVASIGTSLLAPAIAGGVFLTLLTGCALLHAYTIRGESETTDGPTFSTPAGA